MNTTEKSLYNRLTNGKAVSRRTIRKHTTGKERSSIKTWLKARFDAENNPEPEPEETSD